MQLSSSYLIVFFLFLSYSLSYCLQEHQRACTKLHKLFTVRFPTYSYWWPEADNSTFSSQENRWKSFQLCSTNAMESASTRYQEIINCIDFQEKNRNSFILLSILETPCNYLVSHNICIATVFVFKGELKPFCIELTLWIHFCKLEWLELMNSDITIIDCSPYHNNYPSD